MKDDDLELREKDCFIFLEKSTPHSIPTYFIMQMYYKSCSAPEH